MGVELLDRTCDAATGPSNNFCSDVSIIVDRRIDPVKPGTIKVVALIFEAGNYP
ncbi:MAG TPA: hypothetical protein VEO19_17175 [Terriglobia bacterium]|nr:hypothetical protein [Terriglobia bacterium]